MLTPPIARIAAAPSRSPAVRALGALLEQQLRDAGGQ
jgi:hypothetical protein